jgi:signal transduction histidine kinase/ligand-binding sensor domain-containing protein/DNA-binding response OmpR family regulator
MIAKVSKHIILVICFVQIVWPAFAIDILRFEWISDRDGLSQNTVRCILQDHKGFMWMGTVNGLNRYNGKEFIVMQPQTGGFVSLPDNRIRSMHEDNYGYIWIRTTANIFCCYDPRLESFIDYDPGNKVKNFSYVRTFSNGDVWLWGPRDGCCHIQHVGKELKSKRYNEKELGSRHVNFVYEDSGKKIWIGTDNGLFCLSDDRITQMSEGLNFYSVHELDNRLYFITNSHILTFGIRRHNFRPAIAFPGNRSLSLNNTMHLNHGLIFVATKEDMIIFDTRNAGFIPPEVFFKNRGLQNANFITDNKGNKWIYNKTGILWRHLSGNHFSEISLIPRNILSTIDLERYEIFHDSHDIIWITTYGNGLFALDLNNRQTCHYTMENSDLPTNYLLCVTEDNSGEIWVGTEFVGISKISLTNYPVKIMYPAPGEKNNRSNAVRLIYEDSQGRYWLGTRTGYLHVYDASFRKIKTHLIQEGLPFVMEEDTLGNIWLGTRGNGVMVFPPSGDAPVHTYRLHDIDRQNTSSNNVYDIIRDSKNRMWIATFGGGLHLAERRSSGISFRHINTRTVNQDMVRVIRQDRSGMIWTGTNDGINVFDPDELIRDKDKYINFHFDVNNDRSLNNNEVKAIFEDSKGRIWFGTTGGGLNLLVREEPLENSWFKHYTAKNGLSNEVVQTIMEDNEGYIWVSTERGIFRFDLQTERFENFSFSGEWQAGLFNEASCWKRKNGELMFGSYSGIIIFNPAEIKYDTYTPPVVITGLKINGVDVRPSGKDSPLSESITMTEKIELAYNQNSFNIEFAMLNYHSPDFNQYAYFLEGYEKDWNPATRYNVAAYRNVPPGTYRFRVKGSNSFGIWTENETPLKIVVIPPFWKSTPAFIFYFVILVVAVFFAVRIILKIHRLNTAVEVEKQLTEYKLRFFTNISHEFRTPLTIIRGSIESLANLNNLPLSVSKHILQMSKSSSRLLRLIDQLLEFRRLQNNKMELKLEKTEAVAFFYDIYSTFKELAERKNIEFLFQSTVREQDMLLDKGKMDKIAYNLLSNAMKYTPENGTVILQLDFSTQDDVLTLSVSDSGTGIPKEKRSSLFVRFAQIDQFSGGTGVGLHLTAELATVHKGKVAYTDSELGGACFSVSIPLSESNYDKDDIVPAVLSSGLTNMITDTDQAEQTDILLQDKHFNHYKLLVIEDDDEVRDFILNQFDLFFTVFSAKDGIEGMEKAAAEQPNLIICDVMMPKMDGFEVTRRLKDNFDTSHIPIILLTAHSSYEHQLEGIQAGADAYIIKPFSIKYLKTRIVKLIEQREKLQQKFAREPGVVFHMTNFSDKDKEFLDRIHLLIEQNMENEDFSVDTFARIAGMGRTVFYKKVKGMTGHSPNEYIRIIRMKKAAELLASTNLNISEVSYKVGIGDPFYFSKCFKAQFGKSPSQFQKETCPSVCL